MNLRYHVELTEEERGELNRMLAGGKHPARRLKRAQILIAADAGLGDEAIEAGVGVSGSTVYRIKRRFVEDGLEAVDFTPVGMELIADAGVDGELGGELEIVGEEEIRAHVEGENEERDPDPGPRDGVGERRRKGGSGSSRGPSPILRAGRCSQ